MMKKTFFIFIFCTQLVAVSAQPIDRKALVERHTVINTSFDSLSSLSLGNGHFAFTVDVTGLQSFPLAYKQGVPLGTESEWGWHSFPDTAHFSFNETLKNYHLNGRDVSYSVQLKEPKRNQAAVNWFRQNPHRLQLGNLGLELIKEDGSGAAINDIKNIHQELNMYTGEIKSHFTFEDVPVDVSTFVDQDKDVVAVSIRSALIKKRRLRIFIHFPMPTADFSDEGVNWANNDKQVCNIVSSAAGHAALYRQIDASRYFAGLRWTGNAIFTKSGQSSFLLQPSGSDSLEFTCSFSSQNKIIAFSYKQIKANNINSWRSFWAQGAAVDFSGSADERAFELERRIILSEYLTKIQCAGDLPPQETGLTYNSWYGKPHLEMHWWHAVHFALWNQTAILEKQMAWYKKVFSKAADIAKRQGYKGVRWQKMTDPAGEESPSSVGAFLIWQQPHFITFAELCYRQHPDKNTLEKYRKLVFATADFMASFAFYDSATHRYILGKGLIPAQERFKPEETYNPTYELAYWHWALTIAQQWRTRSGLRRDKKWDDVLTNLSALPEQNNLYLAAESATDSYTNPRYKTDHPAVLGAYGMLPYSVQLDTTVMLNTFNWIWKNWDWNDTWGWDFPMTAMTATRLGLPEKAMDALFMPVRTNTWLSNGHNYQDERLRLYLPGNGGLLTAIALMCAGYDGCAIKEPGIPKNGKWKVRWEGLQKMF